MNKDYNYKEKSNENNEDLIKRDLQSFALNVRIVAIQVLKPLFSYHFWVGFNI